MRVRAILLTLAVAAIAVALALRERIGTGGSMRTEWGSRPPADAVAPVPPTEPSAVTPSPIATPIRASDPAACANPDGGEADDVRGPKFVSIDGIVSVVDADGREHHDESGELVLFRIAGDDDPKREVATVSNGKFRVDVPRDVCYGVKLVTLNGHPVDFDSCDISRHSESPVAIHARRARAFRVRVVDATTGLDLHGITVVRDVDEVEEDELCVASPPSSAVHLRDAASPIDLEAVARDDRVDWDPRFHFTAAGHAWASISVDYRLGGEVVVPLPRSAQLRVKVKGAPENSHLLVCGQADPISPEDQKDLDEQGIRLRGSCFAAVAARDGETIEFNSLPVGPLVVTVEVGIPPREVVLGEANAILAQSETRNLSIECRRLERRRRVPVSGTIEIQGEWKDSPFSLRLHPLRDRVFTVADTPEVKSTAMERVSEEPLVLRWKAVDVIATDYVASIDELFVQQRFHIGDDGRDDVRIVVGPCGDATIRFVDAETGEPIDVGYGIRWHPEGTTGSYDGRFLDRDEEHKLYRGRTPIGRGMPFLDFWRTDWVLDDAKPVDVYLGTNEFIFHVHRKCGINLKLRCAGTRIAWPEWANCSLDATPGDDETFDDHDSADGGHVALVSHPGRYRVTLPEVPGFEPVPPFEVVIAAGPYAERGVELRRKQ